MKTLDVKQNSPEWIAMRLDHLCASEAPAMMGVSKFMTRQQLLDLKKGWKANPNSKFKERLFQKGHDNEDAARLVLEQEDFEEYPPVVGSVEVGKLTLLASFDGLCDSIDGPLPWEHKDWNETLAANVRNGVLEPLYYWQLEHQLLVADCGSMLFTCSDGTSEKRESMIYVSEPDRRAKLIKGWELFAKDLAEHEIEAKIEVVEAETVDFPVLSCQVIGTEVTTNMSDCLSRVKDLAEFEKNKPFESDQDFADKEKLNKDIKKLRETLKNNVESIKGQFVSFAKFEEMAIEMDTVLRKLSADGEKKVKEAKEGVKRRIASRAHKEIYDFAIGCDKRTKAPISIMEILGRKPDFMGAMKSKRNIDSLNSAVDELLVEMKITLSEAEPRIAENYAFLTSEYNKDFLFLFNDLVELLNQPTETFEAIVISRVDKQREFEAERAQRAEVAKQAREDQRQAEHDRLEIERIVKMQNQTTQQTKEDFGEYHKPAVEDLAQRQQRDIRDREAVIEHAVPTQTERNADAIEKQSHHHPLPAEFVQWQRKHNIGTIAFMELEGLINEFFI